MIPTINLSDIGIFGDFESLFNTRPPTTHFNLFDLSPQTPYDQLDAAKNLIVANNDPLRNFFYRSMFLNSLSDLEVNSYFHVTPDQRMNVKFTQSFTEKVTVTNMFIDDSLTPVSAPAIEARKGIVIPPEPSLIIKSPEPVKIYNIPNVVADVSSPNIPELPSPPELNSFNPVISEIKIPEPPPAIKPNIPEPFIPPPVIIYPPPKKEEKEKPLEIWTVNFQDTFEEYEDRTPPRKPPPPEPYIPDPKFNDSIFIDPKFLDPKFVDAESAEPKFLDPKFVDPKFVDPKFVDPKFLDPKFVDAEFAEPKLTIEQEKKKEETKPEEKPKEQPKQQPLCGLILLSPNVLAGFRMTSLNNLLLGIAPSPLEEVETDMNLNTETFYEPAKPINFSVLYTDSLLRINQIPLRIGNESAIYAPFAFGLNSSGNYTIYRTNTYHLTFVSSNSTYSFDTEYPVTDGYEQHMPHINYKLEVRFNPELNQDEYKAEVYTPGGIGVRDYDNTRTFTVTNVVGFSFSRPEESYSWHPSFMYPDGRALEISSSGFQFFDYTHGNLRRNFNWYHLWYPNSSDGTGSFLGGYSSTGISLAAHEDFAAATNESGDPILHTTISDYGILTDTTHSAGNWLISGNIGESLEAPYLCYDKARLNDPFYVEYATLDFFQVTNVDSSGYGSSNYNASFSVNGNALLSGTGSWSRSVDYFASNIPDVYHIWGISFPPNVPGTMAYQCLHHNVFYDYPFASLANSNAGSFVPTQDAHASSPFFNIDLGIIESERYSVLDQQGNVIRDNQYFYILENYIDGWCFVASRDLSLRGYVLKTGTITRQPNSTSQAAECEYVVDRTMLFANGNQQNVLENIAQALGRSQSNIAGILLNIPHEVMRKLGFKNLGVK